MLSDCDVALNLNNKYVKALDRRAKALRKQAQKIENFEIQVRPGTFDLFQTKGGEGLLDGQLEEKHQLLLSVL